ncbi:MAG: helix-turn-helix domain-containing protein [Pseudomonadota bacterium]
MSSRPLHETVRLALEDYLQTLEGDDPSDLYAMVMREVERPLLECALHHCAGNQTRAAQCLGLSRGTLRKKLREHDLTQDVDKTAN